ncbi:MAG: LysR family transcriptional regulator [Hyphomicrobiales bacterium]|nr:LysR family transcriptional regulator [Hyphomicrobiales bacterium]
MISTSLRRLTVFKAVVDCAGVNAAADAIGISQPSVSAHIRAIERELGATLFVRQRGRKLRPTAAGEALYTYATEAMAKAQALEARIKSCNNAEPGFSLAAQRTLASAMLTAPLASFLRMHPQARISMHSETQETVQDLVRRDAVDLGILYALDGSSDAQVLGREQLVFIASPEHPLARRRDIDVRELVRHAFVSGLRESQFFGLVRKSLARVGLVDYPIVLHLQDTPSVNRAVALNVGLACTLRSAVEEDVATGRIVLLSIAGRLPELRICCLTSPRRDPPELARQFIAHLAASTRAQSLSEKPLPIRPARSARTPS